MADDRMHGTSGHRTTGSLFRIESICRTMNCGVDDILEFVPDVTTDHTEEV